MIETRIPVHGPGERAEADRDGRRRRVREARAMGSPLRLTIESSAAEADAAWAALRDDVELTERALSRHRPDAELVLLAQRDGAPTKVSRRLERALVAADRARRLTGGRFEPRILADLERLGDGGIALTSGRSRDEVAWADRLVYLVDRRGGIQLPVPVDLGGIGKGLALRWGAAAVRRTVPGRSFVVDAGGDVFVDLLVDALGVEAAAGRSDDWLIAIEDPRGGSEPVAVLAVAGPTAICTSSVRLRSWSAPDGRTVHHLIDPTSGEPGGAGLASVTVAGRDPAWCEVWSKTFFLAGATGIAEKARGRGLAAWWVRDDGGLAMTPAAREMTVWEPDIG